MCLSTLDKAMEALDLLHLRYRLYVGSSNTVYHYDYLTASTFDEKERYLSSVIKVLQNDPLLRTSTANMRAHIMRAQVRYEYGMLEEALRDLSEAMAVTNNDNQNKNGSLLGLAWRARADCYQGLGQIGEAEEALRQWAVWDPSRRTKAMKEIQEMRQQK